MAYIRSGLGATPPAPPPGIPPAVWQRMQADLAKKAALAKQGGSMVDKVKAMQAQAKAKAEAKKRAEQAKLRSVARRAAGKIAGRPVKTSKAKARGLSVAQRRQMLNALRQKRGRKTVNVPVRRIKTKSGRNVVVPKCPPNAKCRFPVLVQTQAGPAVQVAPSAPPEPVASVGPELTPAAGPAYAAAVQEFTAAGGDVGDLGGGGLDSGLTDEELDELEALEAEFAGGGDPDAPMTGGDDGVESLDVAATDAPQTMTASTVEVKKPMSPLLLIGGAIAAFFMFNR